MGQAVGAGMDEGGGEKFGVALREIDCAAWVVRFWFCVSIGALQFGGFSVRTG